MVRAGFWRRAIALLIDLLIVFGPWLAILFVTINALDRHGRWDAQAEWWVAVLSYVPWLLYSMLEIFPGATLGKMLLGMRITRADGAPADRWRLVGRYIGKHYPWVFYVTAALADNGLFVYLGGIGLIVVTIGCLYASDEDKRAWHDDWAGTAVALRRRPIVGFDLEPSSANVRG